MARKASSPKHPWFAIPIRDGTEFVLGSVISQTAATHEVMGGHVDLGGVLIYVYAAVSESVGELATRKVTSADLLFAPIITNKMGWRRNSFVAIDRDDRVELHPDGHCFENELTRRFHDEAGAIVDPFGFDWVGPSGTWAYEAIIDLAEAAVAG